MMTSTIRKFGVGVASIALVAGMAAPAMAIEIKLPNGLTVNLDDQRLSGDGRVETAMAVAKHAFKDEKPDVAYVVGYDGLVDAATAGMIDNNPSMRGPILALPMDLKDQKLFALALHKEFPTVKKLVAIGGSAVVSDESLKAVAEAADIVKTDRIAGKDRYETNVAIAKKAFPTPERIYLARGDNMVDAVTAGTLARGPVLIIPREGDVSQATRDYVKANEGIKVAVIGGEQALSDDQIKKIYTAGPESIETTPWTAPEIRAALLDVVRTRAALYYGQDAWQAQAKTVTSSDGTDAGFLSLGSLEANKPYDKIDLKPGDGKVFAGLGTDPASKAIPSEDPAYIDIREVVKAGTDTAGKPNRSFEGYAPILVKAKMAKEELELVDSTHILARKQAVERAVESARLAGVTAAQLKGAASAGGLPTGTSSKASVDAALQAALAAYTDLGTDESGKRTTLVNAAKEKYSKFYVASQASVDAEIQAAIAALADTDEARQALVTAVEKKYTHYYSGTDNAPREITAANINTDAYAQELKSAVDGVASTPANAVNVTPSSAGQVQNNADYAALPATSVVEIASGVTSQALGEALKAAIEGLDGHAEYVVTSDPANVNEVMKNTAYDALPATAPAATNSLANDLWAKLVALYSEKSMKDNKVEIKDGKITSDGLFKFDGDEAASRLTGLDSDAIAAQIAADKKSTDKVITAPVLKADGTSENQEVALKDLAKQNKAFFNTMLTATLASSNEKINLVALKQLVDERYNDYSKTVAQAKKDLIDAVRRFYLAANPNGSQRTGKQGPIRIYGANRYETSAYLSVFQSKDPLTSTGAINGEGRAADMSQQYFASGNDANLIDAVFAGQLTKGTVLLLPTEGTVDTLVATELRRKGTPKFKKGEGIFPAMAFAVGGSKAISDDVFGQAIKAMGNI